MFLKLLERIVLRATKFTHISPIVFSFIKGEVQNVGTIDRFHQLDEAHTSSSRLHQFYYLQARLVSLLYLTLFFQIFNILIIASLSEPNKRYQLQHTLTLFHIKRTKVFPFIVIRFYS